ncbi:MAG: zinc-binding dehydrogenase [Cytophagales bacterium]|nr:zinc-binding dehydrogenase [Bernardetiaceae bacterium]MDW8211717.1 zinc-binding dehydrogenase [Cytophagales bacterium]
MRALQLTDSLEEPLAIVEVPMPTLQSLAPRQAIVRIKAAALNHRDVWISQRMYPHIRPFCTLGSDGCGVVEQVSSPEDSSLIGKTVVINPNQHWGPKKEVQSAQYSILGNPVDGTFAEYIAIDVHRLCEKPPHLTVAQAAALPIAGLTAYRVICKCSGLDSSHQVLITGIGGGVALFALQFALVFKAGVWVTSSSPEKIWHAKQLGAREGFNYRQADWHKQALEATGGFDFIIDGTGGEDFNKLIEIIKPGGKIITYGATAGAPRQVHLPRIFYKQITIQGSTMGNDEEFAQMLQFCTQHHIVPVIDSVRPFSKIISAFEEMRQGKQFGKLVVSMENGSSNETS